jgi:hypothetical protein
VLNISPEAYVIRPATPDPDLRHGLVISYPGDGESLDELIFASVDKSINFFSDSESRQPLQFDPVPLHRDYSVELGKSTVMQVLTPSNDRRTVLISGTTLLINLTDVPMDLKLLTEKGWADMLG